MNERMDYTEENIHRLMQSGMGERAQPNKAIRQVTLHLLKDEISVKPAVDFPISALGLIAIVLMIIIFWWVSQVGHAPSWELSVISVLIGVNLLCIPLGSIVIVNRRRHV